MSLRTRLAIVLAALAIATGLVVATLAYTTTSHQLMTSVDISLRSTARALRTRRALVTAKATPTTPTPIGKLHAHPGGLLSRVIVEIVESNGAVVSITGGPTLAASPHDVAVARGASPRWLRTQRVGANTYRVLTIALHGHRALEIGRNINDVLNSLAALRTRFVLLVLGAAFVAGIVGYLIAVALSRPILGLATTIATLPTVSNPDLNPQAKRKDEVGTLARAFQRALRAVEDSQAQQRRLIQNASHELRTPLTSLRTNIDLLQRYDSLGADDRSRILADLGTETRELTNLLTELVDLALAEQQNQYATTVDLRPVVETLIARFQARSKRQFAATITAASVPIHASPRAIEQVVANLLDNAIKFSPPDSVITVELTPTNFEVTNLADPIDDLDRERIFERFYRTPAARAIDGSGLGLAIVRETITSLGGTAYAYSTTTKGQSSVTIGVTLPAPR